MKETQSIKNSKESNNEKVNGKKALRVFLKDHVITKTKVLSIIGIVFTILMICLFIVSDVKMVNENTTFAKTSLLAMLKERVITLILMLLAGWVPYFYIPAIAYIAYLFMLSGDLLINMELNGPIRTLVINALPILVDVCTVAAVAAIGIYMCNYTTKKYRYTQRTSFSFLDVKIQLYQMMKKQDKYEEAVHKKEKRIEDMQKNDVKIDYKSILKIAPGIIVINLVIALIQHVIN